MDELIATAVLFLLVTMAGWVLAIIGFVRASQAVREVRQLRAGLAASVAASDVGGLPAAPMLAPAGLEAVPIVAPQPPAVPPPVPRPPVPLAAPGPLPGPKRDWEELLTARWGVWLGAAALLLSGVFLVRYAADQGLLGPEVRCLATVSLAGALIAGSEWLHRRASGPASLPDYAPGALAAGGVAVLFAAAYMAGPRYGLVGGTLAFLLLAAASLAGLGLSLRLGQLVAAVGLVGAFVTPLLVHDTAASLPNLFAYLLFVAASALAVVRYAAWIWLGRATTIACALYVAAVAIDGPGADAWAPALFVPAAALLNLLLLPGAALDHPIGRRLAFVPVAALGAAGLLLFFVAPGLDTRLGVLLLVPLTIGKAAAEPRLDWLPSLAALLCLVLIAGWGLPPWQPTGQVFATSDEVLAILPGAWAPEALRPLLLTAAAIGAVFALSGLWGERRRPNPLRWSALAAAVPVLVLAVLYARVEAFQPDILWAGTAVVLATLSTTAAGAAAREGSTGRAGVHAAGATAALALACGAALTAHWLTVALALFLPALAEIEHRADLPPLRRVALAVAALAGIRLLLNPYVLDYGIGLPVAYGIAAAAFAVAARLFRRRTDDGTVAVLELGSAAFVAALAMLEARRWATAGHSDTIDTSFLEVALDIGALSLLALLALSLQDRTGRRALGWAALTGGGVALAGGVVLLLANPAFLPGMAVGPLPILDALLPAYAVPAAAALVALRRRSLPPRLAPPLSGYAVVALFAYVTLEVRHVFHPDAMGLVDAPVLEAELWAWSGAWLLFGLGLMAVGIVTARKTLRLAALAIVALAGAKIFLVDMAGLVGLFRVLSFLGLGLTLIGLGAVYRRFVATAPG